MNLLHHLRTLFNIRKQRQEPPVGTKPPVGGSLILHNVRIKIKVALDDEQWQWLTLMGWRRVDMRTNRRSYQLLSDVTTRKLLDKTERDQAHTKITAQNERKKRK
ncbi:hypothetical protein QN362_07950 [Actimicrobium sp. CCC2.4]|uniref:hypothetical protein n=1 Tax=Actimicrobium sp. CCC2.4 TaxID=3048606 RepID=UPI002AC9475E|nr:hypothetical protein [Actimicrobium sp. CCC2.4]MEB0135262.1 hypothetical protein [Actimicrobium sp. CCC2.4]WPX31054.1 hypothetical protein RHM62_12410 [Actimicrobium sp. CCC2.4]